MNPWWKRPSPDDRGKGRPEKGARRDQEDSTVRSTDVLSDALADAEEISPRRRGRPPRDEGETPPSRRSKERSREEPEKADRDDEAASEERPRRRRRRRRSGSGAAGKEREAAREAREKPPERPPAKPPAKPATATKSTRAEKTAEPRAAAGDARLALLCDVETLAGNQRSFDPRSLLELLGERGKLVVKRGYADWRHHADLKELLHGLSMELIDVPRRGRDRTGAEMKMVVDALEICYSRPHVDTFVLVSGRQELLPLVAKVREADKTIIGVGNRAESERELVDNCDEFLFLDDLAASPADEDEESDDGDGSDGDDRSDDESKPAPRRRSRRRRRSRSRSGASTESSEDEGSEDRAPAEPKPRPPSEGRPDAEPETATEKREAAPSARERARDRRPRPAGRPLRGEELQQAVVEAAREVLARPQQERAWSSLVQQALRERDPEINERALGFDGFTDVLREAEEEGLLELGHDERTGLHYVVSVASAS